MQATTVEVVSVNVGQPKTYIYKDKEVSTAIYKDPITEPRFLSFTQLDGDGQGDLVHHGGRDKAVNVYSHEHYAFWEKELGIQFTQAAAFGENLTVRGMLEQDVCIGDTYQWGEAVVQVCQPRIPCFKLAMKHGVEDMVQRVMETCYSGFYLRVLQEGTVALDSPLTLRERNPHEVTLAFANQAFYHDKENIEAIERILAVEALADAWRNIFTKRLQSLQETGKLNE